LFNFRSPGGSAALFGTCLAPLDYYGIALLTLLLPMTLAAELSLLFVLHRLLRFGLMMCGVLDERSSHDSSASRSFEIDSDFERDNNDDDNETVRIVESSGDKVHNDDDDDDDDDDDESDVPAVFRKRATKSESAISIKRKQLEQAEARAAASQNSSLLTNEQLPIGGSQPAVKMSSIVSNNNNNNNNNNNKNRRRNIPTALSMPQLPRGHADQRFFSFDRLLRTLILFALLSYSSLLQTTLSILSCYNVGPQSVLADAPSVGCEGDDYLRWK
jgi:hypothetical protein